METDINISIEKQIRNEVNFLDTLACNLIELIEYTENENDEILLEHLNELQNSISEWQEIKKYI